MHLRAYFIRCFNNSMRYSRELLVHNDRLIFSGNSSKEIANFLNSLVYRSFKKLSKALEGRRKVKKEPEQNSYVKRPSDVKQEYYSRNSQAYPPLPSSPSQPKILRYSSSDAIKKK